MKNIIIAFSFLMLTGCGILEEANNSLTYVEEMTEYLNEAEQFTNDFQGLVEDAAADPSAIDTLESRLKEMKTEIQEINDLTPPQLADNLHQQVLEYNGRALEGIDRALVEIDKGEGQISELKDLEIVNTFNQLQDLKSNLESLKQ
ncbi:DUF6376 family protein (plasmid) [Cytobacillus spongiae]|uniref:DUF6376 family protein n=1 Tax=Cytobacillus spongiae TaxID=2901381 RepID=UPI001F482423|nr:DUF6376 family protein [Cytobacillus spongiae]UII58334.1 DUF6376 family protein [Cytobacillus spongiae]